MSFPQALIRFLVIVLISWIFMLIVPMSWFISYYLPMSFFLLMGLVVFGVCALGWPFAAPMGVLWGPDKSRVLPGILMTIVWIVFGVVLGWLEGNVWPGVPISSPNGPWFGIIVFGVTLWYAFDGVGPSPFKKPWVNWLFACFLILVLTGIIWSVCVTFDGSPIENHPANPEGLFPGGWWFGFCVWVIVWIQVFGGPMCLQGWPFYKLGTPWHQILLVPVVVILGYICWAGSLRLGISPTFSFGAVGASMIGWSLMHSVAFEMYPFAKHIQPKRGFLNFILEEIVLTAAWIILVRILLIPVFPRFVEGMTSIGLPPDAMDINMLSAFFTLHVTAVVLLLHQFFFMRAPLSIPGPPLGPEELPPEA